MKTPKKFLLLFGALSISGALYLRWLALAFLYRTMDRYWTGIGTTLVSTAVLLLLVSILIARQLFLFERIIAKAKRGEAVSAEERAKALGAYGKVNTLSIITNTVGFFIGQIAVLVIEVMNGAIDANMPRLILTVIQATFVGAIAALFEIYALNNWMAESRQLLRIQDIEVFGRRGRRTISGRITLTSAVTLGFMGINAFCASFALVQQSQDAAPAANIMSEYLKSGAASIVATFIPCILLVRIIAVELRGRIGALSERVEGLGDKGDISSRIYISMNDDFGSMTSRLNGFLDQLSALIVNLRDETQIVARTAQRLSASTDESKLALTLMKSSVNKIVGEGERQNRQIAEAHGDIQGISENARDVEQQVLVQSAAIQQSSASVNEMAANINSVAELAGKAETLSSRLRESSSGGETSIQKAVGAITEIQDASREVQAIIQDIQKIASQTNLLSMNAAIEAAHAGEAGQGFAVVANEVGSLASSSARSAKNIQRHIKNMVAKIDYGVAAISAAGKAFDEINAGIEQTSALIDTISRAMEEQRVGAAETLGSTNSVVEAINTIKTLSSQQREFTEKMAAAMSSLLDSAQAIDLACGKIPDNSGSLDGAVQNVGACVVDTGEAIARMKRHIEVFKLA